VNPTGAAEIDPPLQAKAVASDPEELPVLGLPSPISIRAPSAAQLETLRADRANDLSRFLPSLEASRTDPCAEPERRGAALEDSVPDAPAQIDGKGRGL
jgi:hypothetical protein